MITAFTVRNFKAIGEEPVRIELKPITLLFGANSVGKSSIIHALHYAYEIFNFQNLNAEKSTLASNNLDLGGFQRFVHHNDLNRNIVIRFDFESDYENIRDIPTSLFIDSDRFKLDFSGTSFKLVGVTNCYVEVSISWSQMRNRPYIKSYETGLNGERTATINFDIDKEEAVLQYLNIDHPLFRDVWIDNGVSIGSLIENFIDPSFYKISSDANQESIRLNEFIRQEKSKINNGQIEKNEDEEYKYNQMIEAHMKGIRMKLFEKYGRVPPCTSVLCSSDDNLNITLRQRDALPYWDMPLQIGSVWKESEEDVILIGEAPFIFPSGKFVLNNFLTCILTEPGQYIKELFGMRYLGPLREIPPRNFSGIDPHDESNYWRWSTGLAAWDLLYWMGQQQLDSLGYFIGWSSLPTQYTKRKFDLKEYAAQSLDVINDWLFNENKLNTGYKIVIEHYRELPSTHPLLIALAADQPLVNKSELLEDIIHIPEKTRIWLQDEFQNRFTPHEIGVGISQILPVVIASAGRGWSSSFVVIEQPELHIHPAVQVQLADLFISEAPTKGYIKNPFNARKFLIETHSEHLLLRLLRRINETYEGRLPHDFNPFTADDVAIYYLEKKPQGLCIRRLEISEDGDSKGEWPEGFFEERRAELF